MACPTVCGFVENGGQLDLRGVDDLILSEIPATDTLRSTHAQRSSSAGINGAGRRGSVVKDGTKFQMATRRMASNIWAGPRWADKINEAANST